MLWYHYETIWYYCNITVTLQGTNISPLKVAGAGKMIFLFHRWDMLVPERDHVLPAPRSEAPTVPLAHATTAGAGGGAIASRPSKWNRPEQIAYTLVTLVMIYMIYLIRCVKIKVIIFQVWYMSLKADVQWCFNDALGHCQALLALVSGI